MRWCWKHPGAHLHGLPPLALHPCLDLYGFRVPPTSDRVPVFIFVLCTRLLRDWALPCLDQAGARFGLGVTPSGLVQTRLGSGSRPLVFFRWRPDWMPPILNKWVLCLLIELRALNQADLSSLDGCQVLVWDWLEAFSFPQMVP